MNFISSISDSSSINSEDSEAERQARKYKADMEKVIKLLTKLSQKTKDMETRFNWLRS